MAGLFAWIFLILFGLFISSFIPRSRIYLAKRGYRYRRVRYGSAAGGVLALIMVGVLSPTPDQSASAPVESSGESLDAIEANLADSGGFFSAQPTIDRDKIKKIDLQPGGTALDITVDMGELVGGPFEAADLRNRLSDLLGSFHRVAMKSPGLRTVSAVVLAPAAEQRDQWGKLINGGASVAIISLNINCTDLRAYPADFEWNTYPVYVASRYDPVVLPQLRPTWDAELVNETKLGGFSEQNDSQSVAPSADAANLPTVPSDSPSGAALIAAAPPNTKDEDLAGVHAFCSVVAVADDKDSSAMMEAMIQADTMVEHQLNIPLERANVVVTRVATAFSKGIYGARDCRYALSQ
jgi:hypothetical protein